jgi:drug/metabolite transporter (DMT)-like permease
MADAHLLAGAAAAAAAACCFDGAVILQAAAARKVAHEHALRLALLRSLVTGRRWVLGTAIAILGWPFLLLAFALAPVTVVQPTLALGLIVLLLGGTRVLGEPVKLTQWGAAALVVAGVAMLVAAGPDHTSDTPAATPAVLVGACLGALVLWPYASAAARTRAWPLIIAAGCAFALTALTSKMLTVAIDHQNVVAAVSWAAATAAFAGLGFLSDMTAMQHHPATRVAPPMFVLETALPVASAPALFHERASSTWGLLLGLALTLAGGAFLGRARAAAAPLSD